MNKLETGAGAALVGIGIFQIHDMYSRHAGPLADMRQSDSSDVAARQRIADADTLTVSMALLAGGALSISTRQWSPVIIAATAFVLTSAYYHSALRAPTAEAVT